MKRQPFSDPSTHHPVDLRTVSSRASGTPMHVLRVPTRERGALFAPRTILRRTVFARGSELLSSAKRKFCEVNTCGIEDIKPFTISTSKTNGLKPPEMNTYAKKCRGECTLCRSAGFIGSSPSCSSGRPAHSFPEGRPEAFGFVSLSLCTLCLPVLCVDSEGRFGRVLRLGFVAAAFRRALMTFRLSAFNFQLAYASNSISTISAFVPTRKGGPQVPAPQFVKTSIRPKRWSP
jgi:hypothetical protein